MRFKITLTDIKNSFIPLNYNSYLSSWIYKRIGDTDKEFAQFLHSEGYGEGHRKFKLFNFGPLDLKPFRIHKDRGVFELLGREISLIVSFHLPQIAEPFIKGLFLNNDVFIGDRINGVNLTVKEVGVMPVPEFREVMDFTLLSPCCVSRPAREGEDYAQYLSPDDPEFLPRLINNLKTKFMATPNVPVAEGEVENFPIGINIKKDNIKSKLFTIKAMTDAETKVKGWLFDCTVTAPVEVQEFIWNVGLGEKGSIGFGMVRVGR